MFNLYNDIESALRLYPNLKMRVWKGQPIVEGDFIAYNREMDIEIDTYKVLIMFSPEYPFVFPIVIETSNKIQPRNVTRHIFPGGNLCFGNKYDEAKVCRNGISLSFFLENILNPHLCREYVRDVLDHYPTGERSHDTEGLWESFYELFETKEKDKILWHLKSILNNNLGRNDRCYCGSDLKFKNCHQKPAQEFISIGRAKAEEIIDSLQNNYNRQR